MVEAKRPGMIPVSLTEIAQVTYGRMLKQATAIHDRDNTDVLVNSVVTDSRQAQDGSLFVAIPGEHVDGHDFIETAAKQGACGALVDHIVEHVSLPQVVVNDTVKALGLLAAHNLERRRALPTPFEVVGITGSVGKTTTKDLLAAMLRELGPTVAPIGSFNNEIGLPLTALRVNESTRFLVAEMGASQVGDLAYLTSIVPLDIAVELKVGVAHLGVFGSVDRIAQAKSELITGLLPGGISVLNADDERVAAMDKLAPGRVLWFGLADGSRPQQQLDMSARDIRTDDADHPSFQLLAAGESAVDSKLNISGVHNVVNALAAATVAHELGLSTEQISQVLSDVGFVSPHRMAISHVDVEDVEFTLIDDSFNANPDSMKAGLTALSTWGNAEDKTQDSTYRIAVLGGMLELGEQTLALHRDVGAYCAQLNVDALVAVGGRRGELSVMAQAMVEGAQVKVGGEAGNSAALALFQAADTDEADQIVRKLASEHPGSVVLLKGSHFSGLCNLAERWQGKRFGVTR